MPVLNYYIYLSSIIMCFCLWIVLSPVLSFQPSYTILSLLVVLCHSLLELLSKIGYQNCIVLYRNDILKITTLKLAKIKNTYHRKMQQWLNVKVSAELVHKLLSNNPWTCCHVELHTSVLHLHLFCVVPLIYFIWLNSLSVYQLVHVFARVFQLFFSYLSFHFQFECFIVLFLYCMKIEKLVCGDGYIDKNTCSFKCVYIFPIHVLL